MADENAWIDATAVELGQALADPAIRAELLALLTGTNDKRERQRRRSRPAASWLAWRFATRC